MVALFKEPQHRASVARGVMTGRSRAPKKAQVKVTAAKIDMSQILEKIGDNPEALKQINAYIMPRIEEMLLKAATRAMEDWERRAKSKVPVRKPKIKKGARARKIEVRPASQFSDYVQGKGSDTRSRLLARTLEGHQYRLKNGQMVFHKHPTMLGRVSRQGAFLKVFRFTREAGFLKGRSPAAISVTARGGLRGYTKGQLIQTGGTLRDSIKVESIEIVPGELPIAHAVIVATAPYAAPVHEGRKTGNRGKVGRRPFLLAAGKEVEAAFETGRYLGEG